MKKLLIMLFTIFAVVSVGCEEQKPPNTNDHVHYIHDARTNMCFAIYKQMREGEAAGGITQIKCTAEVKAVAQ